MITIADRDFDGPYRTIDELRDAAGVYVILDYRANESSPYVLDVGESGLVKTRIENHDRVSCWNQHSRGTIYCAVLYTGTLPRRQRLNLELIIRQRYNPPCGDR